MARWLLLAGPLLAVAAVYFSIRGDDALAAGPCGTTHDAMDAEEQQFLGLLHAWRASRGLTNGSAEVSGALNQAAAWFAEWQVKNGATGGHFDNLQRNWAQRAADCGYSAYWAGGSGEGVFTATGAIDAQGALDGMAGHAGSGINIPSLFPTAPAKCHGVGVYRENGRTSWVVVIAQFPANEGCPGGSGGGTAPPVTQATASPTPSVTNTPTHTPTVTPTATPTQPPVFRSWFSQLARD